MAVSLPGSSTVTPVVFFHLRDTVSGKHWVLKWNSPLCLIATELFPGMSIDILLNPIDLLFDVCSLEVSFNETSVSVSACQLHFKMDALFRHTFTHSRIQSTAQSTARFIINSQFTYVLSSLFSCLLYSVKCPPWHTPLWKPSWILYHPHLFLSLWLIQHKSCHSKKSIQLLSFCKTVNHLCAKTFGSHLCVSWDLTWCFSHLIFTISLRHPLSCYSVLLPSAYLNYP